MCRHRLFLAVYIPWIWLSIIPPICSLEANCLLDLVHVFPNSMWLWKGLHAHWVKQDERVEQMSWSLFGMSFEIFLIIQDFFQDQMAIRLSQLKLLQMAFSNVGSSHVLWCDILAEVNFTRKNFRKTYSTYILQYNTSRSDFKKKTSNTLDRCS